MPFTGRSSIAVIVKWMEEYFALTFDLGGGVFVRFTK